MPLVNVDDFLIRKGHGVFDIDEFIQAMLFSDSIEDGYADLRDSHHDLNHQQFTGVEADAAQMAIRAFEEGEGSLTQRDVDIINAGEAKGGTAWVQAFRKAVNAGAHFIEEAITRTNQINRKLANESGFQYKDIPPAFTNDMGNMIANQAWRTPVVGTKSGMIHNEQGALITQYKSAYTGKVESYARPYYKGLASIRKERYPNLKLSASDEIRPGILHSNTINIKDKNARFRLADAVKQVRDQNPNLPDPQLIEMAKQTLSNMPMFRQLAGTEHRPIEMGRHSQQNMERRVQEQATTPEEINPLSTDNLSQIFHPEMAGKGYLRHLTNRANHYFDNGPTKEAIADFQNYHGFDEETTRAIYDKAKNMPGRGKKNKLARAIMEQHLDGGRLPPHANNMVIPDGGAITSPIDEQRQQPQQEEVKPEDTPDGDVIMTGKQKPGVSPSGMQSGREPSEPLQVETHDYYPNAPKIPTPPPPKMNPANQGAPPAPMNPTPPPAPQSSPQNMPAPPMQSLNAYPSQPSASQNTGRGFLDNLMTRLGYAYETMFPSFNKSDDMDDPQIIKEMLENVQLELAKQEVMVAKSGLSINSHADVTQVGNRLKRPNADIITVFHSRGDWDNLAKSFGMTKQEVQYVKVAFK